jgi:hypothetical protein
MYTARIEEKIRVTNEVIYIVVHQLEGTTAPLLLCER